MEMEHTLHPWMTDGSKTGQILKNTLLFYRIITHGGRPIALCLLVLTTTTDILRSAKIYIH